MQFTKVFCSMLLAIALVLASFGSVVPVSAIGLAQQETETITYEVTIVNLTAGQPFSPPVAVTHSADVRMFNVGGVASDALAAIAQAGDPQPMVALLSELDSELDSGVTDVVNVGRPLAPSDTVALMGEDEITDSVTFTIEAAPGDFLSLAAMLICTNDGFVGLDTAALPAAGEEQVVALGAYDAGREDNTELSADLVDPCSVLGPIVLDDDPDGNIDTGSVTTEPAAPIAEHPGIDGGADLSFEEHSWIEVATITVSRVDTDSTATDNAEDTSEDGTEDTEDNVASVDDDGAEEATDDSLLVPVVDDGLVTVASNNDFDQTVRLLEQALFQRGLPIIGIVNHTTNAASVDLELPPTLLVLVGNPNLGTPLMQSNRSIAIDLPQKFLIWEDDAGAVFVTYNDPQYIADRHGIDDQDEILQRINGALSTFTGLATNTLPSVTVADQPIVDDTVIVDEAISNGAGWVVIHADDEGAPGPVIGTSEVLTDGINLDIVIDIDTEAATNTLYAMLHSDVGEAGIYEFPGPDGPVTVNGEVVTPSFSIIEAE